MSGGKKEKGDALLTSWRPEEELASSSVYTNSTVTSTPAQNSIQLPHLAALSPPPNQHLFVINTAECSAADSSEHLRSGKQNPLGWREREGDRGSQTVCRTDRRNQIWTGYKAPTLLPEALSDPELWWNWLPLAPLV